MPLVAIEAGGAHGRAGRWHRGGCASSTSSRTAACSTGIVGSARVGVATRAGQVPFPSSSPSSSSWAAPSSQSRWHGSSFEASAGVLPCLTSAPPPSGQAALAVFACILLVVLRTSGGATAGQGRGERALHRPATWREGAGLQSLSSRVRACWASSAAWGLTSEWAASQARLAFR